MGLYTVVNQDFYKSLQLNAGVVLSDFDLEHPLEPPKNEWIIATTSGGINIRTVPNISDLGEGVDNMPVNTVEGKHINYYECSIGFTNLMFTPQSIARSVAAADIIEEEQYTHIKLREDLMPTDFKPIWWAGDIAGGGGLVVRLKNGLSTDGLNIQTTKDDKGQNQTNIVGHYSLAAQNEVPIDYFFIHPDGTVTMYTVTQNLNNVTSDYSEEKIEENGNLVVRLTPEEDYKLPDSGATVHMGGVDISSTAYKGDGDESGGTVTIDGVTGTVVIAATGTYSPGD